MFGRDVATGLTATLFALAIGITQLNAQVLCFAGCNAKIDYGRGLAIYNPYSAEWAPATVTESDVRWSHHVGSAMEYFTFDRYALTLMQKHVPLGIYEGNPTRYFTSQCRKVACSRPRDLPE